jgi:hypothetical protein
MPYHPITQLPAEANALQFVELRGLEKLWASRREAMEADGRLAEFLRRLCREWAIETGIIERLYHWDRGMTVLLVEQGIDASLIASGTALGRVGAEHVRDLIMDQQSVVEGIFDFVANRRTLSESYIREMHAAFTRHQETTNAMDSLGRYVQVPLIRGAYKTQPNNPTRPDGSVHDFAPPLIVPDEMERLVAWYQGTEAEGSPPEVVAAWLHHRFTQIHPFQDGNGRVARALASMVFVQAGLFPLLVRDQDRSDYIDALERADDGDLSPLIRLFGERQRAALLGALGTAHEVASDRLETLLGALEETLRSGERHSSAAARTIEDELLPLAEKRLMEVANRIGRMEADSGGVIGGSKSLTSPKHWRSQVEQLTGEDFQPDLSIYAAWLRLELRARRDSDFLIVHFQGDRRFGGDLLTAVAFMFGERMGWAPPRKVSYELFHVAATEDPTITQQRFDAWLGDVILVGLEEWRRALAR